MPLTIDEIVSMVDSELLKYENAEIETLAGMRNARLKFVKHFLIRNGFPISMRERFELSLEPFYFQEANYDDLNPCSRDGDLGHLRNVYEIDLAVQTGGYTREIISEADFSKYLKKQSGVIEWRQGRPRFFDKLLLLFSRMRG